MKLQRHVALGLCGMFAIAALFLFVVPFQRELTVVARSDVKFYDGTDQTKAIFELPNGSSAVIVRCRDRKSMIEPVIELSDGRQVYLLSGRYRIDSRPTGLFTRPRYLGCPGY